MNKDRNVGLDLLKCIAMIMIVTVHYLSGGGFLNISLQKETWMIWTVSWFTESLCYVCVNCFVLISGYYFDRMNGGISKILSLCRQVWFYSIFIGLLLFLLNRNYLTGANILHTFFPIATKSYWFINVYIALFLFAPYINRIIDSMDQKQHKRLIMLLLLFFSIPQTFLTEQSWTLDTTSGYGIIWFVVLYILAAYIRLYGLPVNWGKCGWVLAYMLCAILVFISRIIIIYLGRIIPYLQTMDGWWYQYNNLFVLCGSVSLFMAFKDFAIKSPRICEWISFVSGSTLAVFLLHMHPVLNSRLPNGEKALWDVILQERDYHNSVFMPIHMVVSCIGVFACCILIDSCRRKFIQKVWKRGRNK